MTMKFNYEFLQGKNKTANLAYISRGPKEANQI